MTDYTGLKRLCAALISANEAYLDDDCNSEKQKRFHAADDALQDALPPEVVLAIIAENELLRESPGMRAIRSLRGDCADLMAERDRLKAENEALRKDAGRYRWLREETAQGPNIQVSEWVGPHEYPMAGAALDSAIDAALIEAGQP